MKIIIFAGGAGTRLWPLSRRNSPKQFERLVGDKSTLQLAVERVRKFGLENVYISTNKQYVSLVAEQIPDMDMTHILSEPCKRDVAAAVGLSLHRLRKEGLSGPIAILWSDHFMSRPEAFVSALEKAENLVAKNPKQFIFLGETPRFANHNLGWIHTGGKKDEGYEFRGWKYRPDLILCEKMFASGDWLWNPGYFICDIDFVLGLYEKFLPEMNAALRDFVMNPEKLDTEYEKLEAVSFDNAILEKIDSDQAQVLKVDLGWSDPGTLYALKEALESNVEKNVSKGLVMTEDTHDSFIYNEETGKLVTTIGLEGMIVVNTKDAILVCHKDKVPEIKTLLKRIQDDGLEEYL